MPSPADFRLASLVIAAAALAARAAPLNPPAAPPPAGKTNPPSAATAPASSPAEPRETDAAVERLALARARTDLLQQVCALPLNAHQTVGVWAAETLTRDRAVRLWLRSLPAAQPPTVYPDGVCEVEIELAPGRLSAELARLAAAQPGGPAERATQAGGRDEPVAGAGPDFEAAAAAWPPLRIFAAAHPDELPAEPPPAGWEDVGLAARSAARRAAEADARHELLTQAAALQVTNARRLGDFIAFSAAVREAVLAGLDERAAVRVEFAPDQVVMARARVALLDLVQILTDAHAQHYHGQRFKPEDFRNMALFTSRTEVTALGFAVPPGQTVLRAGRPPSQPPPPAWTADSLTAAGRFTPLPDEVVARAVCVAAARREALKALREQLEQFELRPGLRTADLLAAQPGLRDDITAFINTASVIHAPELPGQGAEVQLELPLRGLWNIVRGSVVQPAASPAPPPAANERN